MPTILHIDASPLGTSTSFSRQLTADFVQQWKSAYSDGSVIRRDLTATPLTALNADWIAAAYTAEADRTQQQREVLALSDELIGELQAADEYVVGVPMHNFSVPGVLKLWIDQVARAGKTFSYASGGPVGLLKGKRATFILTSGGTYDAGTPLAALDFVEPYLRSVFAFLGVTDVQVIRAGGTAKARDEQGRVAVLQPARAAILGALPVAA